MTPSATEMSCEATPEAIVAYCTKCNVKRVMVKPEPVELGNKKHAVRGVCGECGCKLFRMGGSDCLDRPKGYYVARARERRLEVRKVKLLDGVPPIRAAYWGGELNSEEADTR
tara:strand:- start:739 stop:1077 length:339 start_codon:yes stop_codon:yes gene_type:complete